MQSAETAVSAVTHQSCRGFSIRFYQIDHVVLLLLPLLLPPSAAALDADTQTADENQQTSGRKDGVNRPSRHCRRQDGDFSPLYTDVHNEDLAFMLNQTTAAGRFLESMPARHSTQWCL